MVEAAPIALPGLTGLACPTDAGDAPDAAYAAYAADATDAADAADLAAAWDACYLDPARAGALGRRVAGRAGGSAPWGWLHVALCEARVGDAAQAWAAVHQARAGFAAAGNVRGLALADESQAIQLRRDGDAGAAARLQQAIDARGDPGYLALDRFVAHNSRAITCRVLGRVDDALRHFHAACDAAEASGNVGARIAAASNLGSLQQELYNLEDARELSERAFRAAREARAPRALAAAVHGLITIYSALGEPLRAREMVDFAAAHPDEFPGDLREQLRVALALGHVGMGEIDEAEALLAGGPVDEPGAGDGQVFWAWLSVRCALARGDAARARSIAERTLRERVEHGLADSPYDLMELHRGLADACEQLGDAGAALVCVRRAQALYEQLVGRSARARRVALQVGFDLARAQRERDRAVDLQRAVEADRQRLAELNAALEQKIAENESLQTQLREQALRDPLTGLHNRRYLFEVGPGLLEMARRRRTQVAVVLLDLDHFKLLNDTYGHQAGDMVLRRFGSLLAQALRRSDVVCRHGGEEFVALMPEIDGDGAQAMLARLLEVYEDDPPEPGRRRLPRCTFSAGIALYPRHGGTLEQLLSRADRALYRAKQQGRSRIEQVPASRFSTLS